MELYLVDLFNNIRWEVASSNTGSGTFSLLVRRGNDSNTSKNSIRNMD